MSSQPLTGSEFESERDAPRTSACVGGRASTGGGCCTGRYCLLPVVMVVVWHGLMHCVWCYSHASPIKGHAAHLVEGVFRWPIWWWDGQVVEEGNIVGGPAYPVVPCVICLLVPAPASACSVRLCKHNPTHVYTIVTERNSYVPLHG